MTWQYQLSDSGTITVVPGVNLYIIDIDTARTAIPKLRKGGAVRLTGVGVACARVRLGRARGPQASQLAEGCEGEEDVAGKMGKRRRQQATRARPPRTPRFPCCPALRAANPNVQVICYFSAGTWEKYRQTWDTQVRSARCAAAHSVQVSRPARLHVCL